MHLNVYEKFHSESVPKTIKNILNIKQLGVVLRWT